VITNHENIFLQCVSFSKVSLVFNSGGNIQKCFAKPTWFV